MVIFRIFTSNFDKLSLFFENFRWFRLNFDIFKEFSIDYRLFYLNFDILRTIFMSFSSFLSFLIEFRHYWALLWSISGFLLQILINYLYFLKIFDDSDWISTFLRNFRLIIDDSTWILRTFIWSFSGFLLQILINYLNFETWNLNFRLNFDIFKSNLVYEIDLLPSLHRCFSESVSNCKTCGNRSFRCWTATKWKEHRAAVAFVDRECRFR